MPSIWLPWARPAAPCAVPAARRSGWRGRRMRSRPPLRYRPWRKPAAQPPPSDDAAAEWEAMAREDDGQDTPVVDSPSISADWPAAADRENSEAGAADWASAARHDIHDAGAAHAQHRSWFRKLMNGRRPRARRASHRSACPPLCAAMGALVLALMIWRVDVVRLLPQTADVLQDGRPRREPARAAVQGRQDHHRNRGRQAGAGDRGRDHRRSPQAGRAAAAAL